MFILIAVYLRWHFISCLDCFTHFGFSSVYTPPRTTPTILTHPTRKNPFPSPLFLVSFHLDGFESLLNASENSGSAHCLGTKKEPEKCVCNCHAAYWGNFETSLRAQREKVININSVWLCVKKLFCVPNINAPSIFFLHVNVWLYCFFLFAFRCFFLLMAAIEKQKKKTELVLDVGRERSKQQKSMKIKSDREWWCHAFWLHKRNERELVWLRRKDCDHHLHALFAFACTRKPVVWLLCLCFFSLRGEPLNAFFLFIVSFIVFLLSAPLSLHKCDRKIITSGKGRKGRKKSKLNCSALLALP